jgi:hypothetical protein
MPAIACTLQARVRDVPAEGKGETAVSSETHVTADRTGTHREAQTRYTILPR